MFQVVYDTPSGLAEYCLDRMTRAVAEKELASFTARYMTPDGGGKAYPNGKGFYPFRNPRIVAA